MASVVDKKEFPSQIENRKQWALDTVRANQSDVASLLYWLNTKCRARDKSPIMTAQTKAKLIFDGMHKMDRDALLVPGGILTQSQIEILTTEGHEHE